MSSEDAAAPPRFRVGEFVRWSDVDLAGIVCYGAYVRFFELAESELFRAAGFPYGEVFERFDFWLPRAQLHFDFRRPAVLDDRLEVAMGVAHVGRSSLRLAFQVEKAPGGEVTAEGHAVLVATSRATLRPIPLPPELAAALRRYRTLRGRRRRRSGLGLTPSPRAAAGPPRPLPAPRRARAGPLETASGRRRRGAAARGHARRGGCA